MRSPIARLAEPLESRRFFSAVVRLSLIDADTDQVIPGYESLGASTSLNLATLPTRNLNVKATVDTAVGSVRFGFDGKASYRVEDAAPYAIGSDKGGDYYGWRPTVGRHVVTATPYSAARAAGAAGRALAVALNVIDSKPVSPNPTPKSVSPVPRAVSVSSGSTFAHVYVVGAGGPYTTIQAAANVAGPGDEVLIGPGTYFETLTLPHSGTAVAPITFVAQTPGTVTIDATGRTSAISPNGAVYITIDGVNVNHAAGPLLSDPPAVGTGNGWQLRNMTVANTDGTGVCVYGSDVVLYNVTAEYNGRAGISGDFCSNVLVQNCTTRFNNNAGQNDPDYDGGAGKWFQTNGVTIDNLTSYGNTGPGIWFDYLNTNVVVKNSRSYNNHGLAHDWSGNGVRVELSLGPMTLTNNTFFGNTGAQVDIQSSKHVTLTGNTIAGTDISLRDWPRGDQFALSDITITDNWLTASGLYTEGGTWDATSGVAKAITIDRNTYERGLTYLWAAATYNTLDDVRGTLHFELNGNGFASAVA